MDWYIQAWKQYAGFSGRSQRSAYWFFVLFNMVFAFALSFLDGFLGLAGEEGVGPLYVMYGLAALIPGIAVGVRRLHDIGRTGWWSLIVFVPLIGVIVLLVFYCTDSQPGDNQYGANPKESSDVAVA